MNLHKKEKVFMDELTDLLGIKLPVFEFSRMKSTYTNQNTDFITRCNNHLEKKYLEENEFHAREKSLWNRMRLWDGVFFQIDYENHLRESIREEDPALSNIRLEMLLELDRLRSIMSGDESIHQTYKIKQITNCAVVRNGNIVGLGLKYLDIYRIPKSIENLNHLKVLFLDSPDLNHFPSGLKHLRSLETLVVESSSFSILNHLGSLRGLKKLVLRQNQLDFFHPNVNELGFSLPALRVCKIHHNSLAFFPPFLKQSYHLRFLNLTKNEIEQFPRWIYNFKELIKLDLSHNQIKQIPYFLTELVSLRNLSLSGNKLKRIPAFFKDMDRIRHLNLDGNQFVDIPSVLAHMKGLSQVSLANNPIRVDPPQNGSWQYWSVLKHLDERFSKFESWTPNILIKKVKYNIPLDDVDRTHPYLPKYADYIFKKIAAYETEVKQEVIELLLEVCSVPIKSGFKILK